jgi:beta-lactamase superfamily II metal-dependent hydrolase
MYEVDFFAAGEGERSGDAIALRYTISNRAKPVVGIIDAGFLLNGDALVEHVPKYYGTERVDFVLSTHPDEDHINGMGVVVRELDVQCLLIHRPAQHGYGSNSGSKPAEELAKLADAKRAKVVQPFTGTNGWGESFVIAGPTESFYRAMLAEQTKTTKAALRKPTLAARFGAPVLKAVRHALATFPVEPNFGDAGGDNPRNNSSAILSLMVDGRHLLFLGDAGVPAINPALDYLHEQVRTNACPAVLVLPHHGSRHNLDRGTIQRILGDPDTSRTWGYAVASVSAESDNPSPRVANAVGRRGYNVVPTAGAGFRIPYDAPDRPGWSGKVDVLPPLAETDLED